MSSHNLLQQQYLADANTPDPGDAKAICLDISPTVCNLVTGGAETRTLPDPDKTGLRLTLSLDTDGGDCVVTADSAINRAGSTIMTFSDAGEIIELVSVSVGSAILWRVVANDGVALS